MLKVGGGGEELEQANLQMLKKCTTESEENWFSDHGGEWVKTQSS